MQCIMVVRPTLGFESNYTYGNIHYVSQNELYSKSSIHQNLDLRKRPKIFLFARVYFRKKEKIHKDFVFELTQYVRMNLKFFCKHKNN